MKKRGHNNMAFGKVIGLDSSTSWEPQVSVIPSYIHHFDFGDSVTVYVSTNSGGSVTAKISGDNASLYNVQKINNNEFVINRVGNKVPMTSLKSATLTITVAADSSKGFNSVTRTVKIENPVLSEGSYVAALSITALSAITNVGLIQNALNYGIAENIWNVGDSTANITLSGVVGARSFNNYTSTCAYILGFNHNAALETGGKKSIHFCLGRFASNQISTLRGKDLAFVDGKLYETGSTAAFRMNLTNSNSGGWQHSYMRTVICAQFLSAINAAWTTYIKP